MAERVGQQVGDYHLIRLLGMSTFAEVYLGEHGALQTWAAIKVFLTHLADHDAERFLQEAQKIARLEHPHIARLLDFGVEQSMPFLAMAFAPNGTLRQRHPAGTELPLETILPYIQQVSQALQYAHDQGVMHEGIRPENLLVGSSGELLLSDFRISSISESTSRQHLQEFTGTAAYAAPEQIQGQPCNASDQYTLGIVIYEWLSGTVPFTGSLLEVLWKQVHAPPPTLREKLPALPPLLEQVLFTALAKDPQKRFASVRAFAQALVEASKASTPLLASTTQVMTPSAPSETSTDRQPLIMPPTMTALPPETSSSANETPTIKPSTVPSSSRASSSSHPPVASPKSGRGLYQWLGAKALPVLVSAAIAGIVVSGFYTIGVAQSTGVIIGQHVIDGLTVSGTLLGIVGFFYLTYEFFGRKSLKWLIRVLTPSLISALILGPVGVLEYASFAGWTPFIVRGGALYGLVGLLIGTFNGIFVEWPSPLEKPHFFSLKDGLMGFSIAFSVWFVAVLALGRPLSMALEEGLILAVVGGLAGGIWRFINWTKSGTSTDTHQTLSWRGCLLGLFSTFLIGFFVYRVLGSTLQHTLLNAAILMLSGGIAGGAWRFFAGEPARQTDRAPLFSWKGALIGLIAVFLFGWVTAFVVDFTFQIPLVLSVRGGLNAAAFIGPAGAITGGLSRFIFWRADSLKDGQLAGIGAILTLLGFLILLLPPLVSIFDLPIQ